MSLIGTTKTCYDNAFNPSWDEKFEIGLIHLPSLAVLRISVYNQIKNPVTINDLICQTTLPLDHLRQGYRSVRMRNAYGEVENCLASLLVHVKIDRKASMGQDVSTEKKALDDIKELLKKGQEKGDCNILMCFLYFWTFLMYLLGADEINLNIKEVEEHISELMSQKVWFHGAPVYQPDHQSFNFNIRHIKSEKFKAIL